MLSALNNPNLEQQICDIRDVVRHRYQALKQALDDARIPYVPFNSGFFTLIPVQCDPEELRLKLLNDGVGIVSFAGFQAIRIAYSSARVEDLPTLVSMISKYISDDPAPSSN